MLLLYGADDMTAGIEGRGRERKQQGTGWFLAGLRCGLASVAPLKALEHMLFWAKLCRKVNLHLLYFCFRKKGKSSNISADARAALRCQR